MARVLSIRLFPVQVQGGIILHQGRIAEMKTGEGKTFTLALPAYLNALTGKGVHVVTVNEYLAKYQGEMMARVFNFMGLTVGLALTGMSSKDKKGRLRLRHHLRHQQRDGLRLPPGQHGHLQGEQGAAGPQLRHRGRGGLHPHRRGPHPPHHLRPGGQGRRPVTPGPTPSPGASSPSGSKRPTRKRTTDELYKDYDYIRQREAKDLLPHPPGA